MLVDILAGRDSGSATSRGSYHFASVPRPGDQVELDGSLFVVSQAWHRPDICYKGAKFAILVKQPAGQAGADSQVRNDAGLVV